LRETLLQLQGLYVHTLLLHTQQCQSGRSDHKTLALGVDISNYGCIENPSSKAWCLAVRLRPQASCHRCQSTVLSNVSLFPQQCTS